MQPRREGPVVKAGGVRACAERTLNMDLMSMTLDVSKLSGWLNADANCRVEKRARCGPGGGRAWAGRSGHAASTGGKGPTEGRGASACAERTENMVQGEVYGSAGGRRRATTPRRRRKVATCRGGSDRRLGVGGTEVRTYNMNFMFVTPEVTQLDMSASKFSKPLKR